MPNEKRNLHNVISGEGVTSSALGASPGPVMIKPLSLSAMFKVD